MTRARNSYWSVARQLFSWFLFLVGLICGAVIFLPVLLLAIVCFPLFSEVLFFGFFIMMAIVPALLLGIAFVHTSVLSIALATGYLFAEVMFFLVAPLTKPGRQFLG